MEIYREVEQGSEEWFRLKYGKIGGTRASGIYVNSDTLMLDLLSERAEEFYFDEDDLVTTKAMEYGTDMEPQARRELEKYLGKKLLDVGWIQSDIPLLGISPDGITEDLKEQAEIKCPQRKKHIENCLNPNIDFDYIAQCIHAFTVNPKLEKLHFLSFRPQNLYMHMCYRSLDRNTKVAACKSMINKDKVWEDRGKGLKEYVSNEIIVKRVAEWVEYSQDQSFKIEAELRNEIKKISL